MQMPVIERAYQMAKSGDYSTVTQIKAALVGEGYMRPSVSSYLSGLALQRDLNRLIKSARARA